MSAVSEPPLLGLLTGNIRLGAEIKLRHYQLWEYFSAGAFGDDHECRRQLALLARKRAGQLLGKELGAEEIVVVGDTPLDIDCAQAIDARVLAVATGGYPLDALEAHRPTWAVPNLGNISVEEICG